MKTEKLIIGNEGYLIKGYFINFLHENNITFKLFLVESFSKNTKYTKLKNYFFEEDIESFLSNSIRLKRIYKSKNSRFPKIDIKERLFKIIFERDKKDYTDITNAFINWYDTIKGQEFWYDINTKIEKFFDINKIKSNDFLIVRKLKNKNVSIKLKNKEKEW